MADKKISELTELAGSAVAMDDELVIVDTSAGATKKITVDSLISNEVDTTTGGAGSVAVVEDVNAGLITSEIFAKTFDKNVLLRDGDDLTFTTTTAKNLGSSDIETTDVLLARVNLKSVTTSIRIAKAALAAKFYNATVLSAVGVYYGFLTYYSGWNGSDNLISPVNETSGTSEADYSVFNLTALGTYTAEQVLALASLGVTVTTSDSWEDIASATGYSSDIWDILIPSHVSSMEPTIVSSLVNRGGNLGIVNELLSGDPSSIPDFNGSLLMKDASGASTIVSYGGGKYLCGDSSYEGCRIYVKGAPNESWSIKLYVELDTSVAVQLYYSSQLDIVSADGYLEGTISLDSNGLGYFTIENTGTGGLFYISQIQLNEGSTANTYSAPLDSPFTVGSRSVNQLPDGNGENGGSKWTQVNGTFIHDGTDYVLTNVGGRAYADQVPNIEEGTVYCNVTDVTDSDAIIRVYCDAQMDADPSGWTWFGADSFYFQTLSSATEIAGYFEGINSIRVTMVDATVSDTIKVKQIMLVKGEYTLAQLQDLGYVSYEPVTLLSCQNNAETSTVGDRIYGEDGKIWLEHNVQTVDGFKYGDPEIDATEILTGDNLDFGSDQTTKAGFDSAYSQWQTTGSIADANIDVSTNVLTLTSVVNGHGLIYTPAMTVGKKYRFILNVTSITGTWKVDNGADSTALITTTGIHVLDFVATNAGLLLWASGGTYDITVDASSTSLSLTAFNIQENLAPTLEDITEFCNGSLGQPATYGQNHIVTEGSPLLSIESKTGFGAIADNVSKLRQSVAYKTDIPKEYRVTVVLPAMVDTDEEVFLFTDFSAVNTIFPGYIKDATVKEYTLGDTDLSFAVYENALVVSASGNVSDDTECNFIIGEAEPNVTIDRSA